MGHKGHYGQYSGNHPRFSKRQDEAYDAKMAYDKDLTGKARLHYLENDIADKKSPANSHCSPMHNDKAKRLRERAIKISERRKYQKEVALKEVTSMIMKTQE
jgi:hypothetical protein